MRITQDSDTSATTGGSHDYAALFRVESGRLYRSLYAYAGGRRDVAEDATVEAFARAIAEGDRVRDPVPWLYRTAFRVAAGELKADHASGEQPEESIDPSFDSGIGVLDALRSLPPRQRSSVVLHYLADLPVEEVAKRMGVSASTVKVHLFRARSRLRELLGDEEVENP
jgi:RNA polymerase sigma-70 factor, ECF subfamily